MDLQKQFEKETNNIRPDSRNCDDWDDFYYELQKWQVLFIGWLGNKIPQWIDVNDRLPERFKRVLVTDGKEVTQAYIGHVKDTFQGQFLLNEEWLEKPTYWAELPLPPIKV